MKTIITVDLPKKDGEIKSRLYLAHVNDEGAFTELTFRQWKGHTDVNTASEFTKIQFIEALIRQVDRFSLKIDYVKYVENNNPSFTEKVEWLLSTGGCLYTKRGLLY